MKNPNYIIENRTRVLLACSAVTQPTAPPRASFIYVLRINVADWTVMLIRSKRTFRNMRRNEAHISGSGILSKLQYVKRWICMTAFARRSQDQTAHFAERNKDICFAWRQRQCRFNKKFIESMALRFTVTCVWKEWLCTHAAGTKWGEMCLHQNCNHW
jgi:hypothetical protein